MSEPFPPAFRECLRQILRRAPRVHAGRARRDTEARARRKQLARSGTFAEHRAYSRGDDLRYVDWNVYARTGDLFLKVLEEDDRRTLTILLDRSRRMMVGEPLRYRGAQRLAAILGGLALAQLDGLTLVAGPDEVHSFAEMSSLERLLGAIAAVEPGPHGPLELIGHPLARRATGSVVWVSDFADPEAVAPALHLLRRQGCRCTGWLPALTEDRHPTASGRMRLRDPDTGVEQVFEIDEALRRAMTEELMLLARHQDSIFASVGYPLVRFPLPEENDFRLTSWFTGPWTYRL